MRIGSALLITTAALALAFTTGGGVASTRHYHHRHARPADVQRAPDAPLDTSLNGNNPAKRYQTRHMSEAAIKTDTLLTTGNNPTKRYAVRHGSNLRMEATLSTTGNNPAKHYAAH